MSKKGSKPPPVAEHLAVPEDGAVLKGHDQDGWKRFLVYGRKGNLEPESLANVMVLLEHAPQYRGVFVLNKFSDEIIVRECPPWENEADFKVHRLEDEDVVRCAAALEYPPWCLSATTTRVKNAIEAAARKQAIHPVRDYFDSLEWDGEKRLHTWLMDYLNAASQPQEYTGPIGVKWMVAAVRRVYDPGVKFDHMLVLEGAQNIGKSYALRTISTFGRDEEAEYFTDAIRFETINDAASIMALQGKIVVEFSELAGMSRKEIEEVKNWITVQKDVVQKKYKNEITEYPRQFVLAGTTNEDTWLRDATGNRRFLPVKCGDKKFDIPGLRAVREQLWAEAVWLHKDGMEIMIDHGSELEELAQAEQASRLIEDVWTEPVIERVRNLYTVTVNEVLLQLQIETGRRDEMSARRVSRILRLAGWKRTQKWISGRNVKIWENPLFAEQIPVTGTLGLKPTNEE